MTVSETLAEILPTINKYYESTKFTRIPTPQRMSISDFNIPPLALATPTTEFEATLRHNGLSTEIRALTVRRAAEVATLYRDSYAKTCQKLLDASGFGPAVEDTINSLRRTYEHLYETKDLPAFLTTAVRAQKASQQRVAAPERERQPFNHAFVPYLEAYFEQNAYPSHADMNNLTMKGKMDRAKIVNWFQNRRNRLRGAGRESEIKRLSPGQAINIDMIEESIKAMSDNPPAGKNSFDDGAQVTNPSLQTTHLKLDDLATPMKDSIPKFFETKSTEPFIADSEAFGLPSSSKRRSQETERLSLNADDLHEVFGDINIRLAASPIPEKSTPRTTETRHISSRASTPTTKARKSSLKAALRSCFSAAITLTCPSVHPALIRQQASHTHASRLTSKRTILERKHVPVQPYTLPTVLPTWKMPASFDPEPVVGRKKPTISSHAGKTRPGSPYPQQTISRMSSTSSLASISSDDSQSSSRSSSSTFSVSTVDSSELDTPAQSPSPDNVELIDDSRFSDDIFGDFFLHSNPIPDSFFFDINVEQPFDKDVALSFAEFDKSISMSIAEFDATTLPSFDFFES